MTVLVFTPALSNWLNRASESSKLKPRLRIGAPNCTTVLERSSKPMPDVCEARNILSSAPDCSLAVMFQSPNTRVVSLMLAFRSVPVMRERLRNCLARPCSGLPVRPRRVFRSAIAVPTSPMSAGTSEYTALKSSFRPSSASPVAPVPTRMVS